jgi:hypothetical protein
MKIIILIIAQKKQPYIELEAACRNTWASVNHPDIQILYLHAQPNVISHIDNDELIVNGEEGLYNIGYKTIKAFEYCLNNLEFDYIYRTNLSSYVDQVGLYKYANTCPLDDVYNGVIGNYNDISFASGSGYLISKNLVKYTVTNKNEWNHIDFIDDVSLAKVLKSNNISPTYVNRIDILDDNALTSFDTSTIQDCFHFRCKSETDRQHDIKVMNMLYYNFFINHYKEK